MEHKDLPKFLKAVEQVNKGMVKLSDQWDSDEMVSDMLAGWTPKALTDTQYGMNSMLKKRVDYIVSLYKEEKPLTRTEEIAKLLNISNKDAMKVQREMDCSGIDYSECSQREFDEMAMDAYRYLHRYEKSI